MTFLASQPTEERQQLQLLQQTPGDPDAFKPGLFEGSGTAAAIGAGRVASVAAQLVNEPAYQLGALFTRPIDELFDTKATDWLDVELRQKSARLTASMAPDPMTTGTIGRILYGVVGIGTPAAAGAYFGGPAGAAALAGGFTGAGTFTDLTQQGVDPNTAAGAAALDTLLTAGGVALPAAIGGKVALNALLYGPGINVAQDLIAGQGTAALLESQGYTELAERYSEIDAEMLAADAILGAAFGWAGARAGRVPRGAMPTAVVDAAQVALDQRHVELDTAPGIPADMAALQAHTRALQSATEALLDGRPVEANALGATFVDKPVNPAYADDAMLQTLRESGLPDLIDEIGQLEGELERRGRMLPDEALPELPPAIPRDTKLSGLDAMIEDRLAQAISADLPGAINRYGRLPEAEGGKVLNTDLARELSGEYQADRTRSAAVHEPASWLVKEMYRRKLREAPAAGERGKVLFTAGGTGAGKTSAIEGIPAAARMKSSAQLVYDTNMNGLTSSVQKIEQALKAGKEVQILHVLRDPVEALVKGALPRAERTGRTVPIAKHAETHAGSADTLRALAAKYADHPMVNIQVIENLGGKGKQAIGSVASLDKVDYSNLTARLREALDKEYERGAISEAVYRGTAGKDAASAGLRRAADTAGGRADEAAGGNGRKAALGADRGGDAARAATQDGEPPGQQELTTAILADAPQLAIVDDAGESIPAAAALSDADRTIAQAEQDAPGFLAAVNCFMRNGA